MGANNNPGLSQVGGLGDLSPPQFLAEKLTLSQQGGHIMPITVLQGPPKFWELATALQLNSSATILGNTIKRKDC